MAVLPSLRTSRAHPSLGLIPDWGSRFPLRTDPATKSGQSVKLRFKEADIAQSWQATSSHLLNAAFSGCSTL